MTSRCVCAVDHLDEIRASIPASWLPNLEAACPVHGIGEYERFLASKRLTVRSHGHSVRDDEVNQTLYPFQRDLVRWACRKGRAAIFADTGLYKTGMQAEWARLMGGKVLIVAPLSVAQQTIQLTQNNLGVDITYSRDGNLADGITITNYEMIGHFDPRALNAVVLDESSILKAMDGKTRQRVTEMFAGVPYRLCCTATPAPNDITEIANHAEFLGIMSRAEMLAAFFVHVTDTQAAWQWRLKGHAEEPFYRWLASWGMSVRLPSDLGYEDDGFILPPLDIQPVWVDSGYVAEGQLFNLGLHGVGDRIKARKATVEQRIKATIELVARTPGQWVLWCGLNAEQDALAEALGDSCISIYGSLSLDEKTERLGRWLSGERPILLSKARICGYGLNLQQAHQMAFVGLNDSWESYYQCIRRCYRFGQTEAVKAYIVLSDAEEEVYTNVMRKEEQAQEMRERLISHVREYEREEISETNGEWVYETAERKGENWRMLLGDSCERLAEIADESIDLSVFSPPFLSLYTYSPTERDVGNSRTPAEFYRHFGIIIDELMRVTRPGRNCCVHVSQVSTTLATDGVIGLRDFRGGVIRQFVEQGWTYYGEVCIDKDPQAQAIRTHSKGLLFIQLHKDSVASRPALADYILIFQKPGVNAVPVKPDISNDEWIEWARPVWYGIRESETLNAAEGRDDKDDKHIAPLQLGTTERCVRLWSNKGETVLSPFAGIGSEGYIAVKHGRRFVGIELKRSYYDAARKNLARAAESISRRLL